MRILSSNGKARVRSEEKGWSTKARSSRAVLDPPISGFAIALIGGRKYRAETTGPSPSRVLPRGRASGSDDPSSRDDHAGVFWPLVVLRLRDLRSSRGGRILFRKSLVFVSDRIRRSYVERKMRSMLDAPLARHH